VPPFTGGWSPSPERYGGGEGSSDEPLVQRIFESIAAQRGSAYSTSPTSIVGIEMRAWARAIAFDAWGVNARLANQFIPSKLTAASGMLQRWERIFAVPPLPTDTEPVRRARVAAAWASTGQPNSVQPVISALQAALGPVYVGLVHQTALTETSYTGGLSNVVATGTTPPTVTISGTPTGLDYFEIDITTGGALGAALFTWKRHGATIATGQTTSAAFTLPGTGVVVAFGAGPPNYATDNVYKFTTNPQVPWLSSLAHVDVQVTQNVAGYNNAGAPNAAFYQLVANVAPILDEILPAWATYDWFIQDSASVSAFKLDERNLDLEVLT